DRQPFRVTVGEPISAKGLPAKSEEGIEVLREATLALGGHRAPAVSLVENSRRPFWLKALKPT
ncbi:MAG: glycerol acyltransferase, partial [Pseudomonadota bacterium]|nr:glycerol acyltransferase [Pseudomonadota bacterium]